MSCKVVSNKGHPFGPENVLMYMILNFRKKLVPCWEDNKGEKIFISMKLDIFQSCLQGITFIKWDLCSAKYTSNKWMEKHLAHV
jgi:hypothetical protein